MRPFRGRGPSRVLALVLLVAALGGMPHAAQDDPACAAPPLEQHDESQHAIGAAATAGHEHCAVCHWSRTFRSPLEARWVSDLALAAGSLLRPGRADGRRSADPGRLPARAPPSLLA